MRIAILGSCVSRDGFQLFPCRETSVTSFVARTSLVSMFAAPLDVVAQDIVAPNAFEARCIFQDVTGRSLDVLKADADVLLVDLMEERFDLYEIGESRMLNTGYFQASGIPGRFPPGRVIRRLSDEATTLWKAACLRFGAELQRRRAGKPCRVLLHRAWHAPAYRENGELKDFAPPHAIYAQRHNPLMAEYYAFFEQSCHPDGIIEVAREKIIADAAHRWKLQPFHYAQEYYAEFMAKLRVCLNV